MELNRRIGVIGAGNMGEAFVGAILRAGISDPSMIFVSDINKERLDILVKRHGIKTIDDNTALFSECGVVILAVKPQQMDLLLSEIAVQKGYHISDRKVVISIAAGITLKKLEDLLYSPLKENSKKKLPIIRVMPNTPALVLSGMSGMSSNRYATADDVKMAREILSSMGKVIEFKEDELDAVTALSGSGPAYVFYLVESMIQAGINIGLDPDDAAILTLTTLKGALKLMEERNESPERLRQQVTSPGGTTEAAFKVLEKNGVKQSLIEAVKAARRRSKELSG